ARCPFPGRIDAREPAVVELVENGQGELDVLAVGIRAVGRDVPHGIVHRATESLDDLGGDGSAGRGKRSVVHVAHPGLMSHTPGLPSRSSAETTRRSVQKRPVGRCRNDPSVGAETTRRSVRTGETGVNIDAACGYPAAMSED